MELELKDTRSGFGAGLLELGKKNKNVVALCADLTGSLKMDAFEQEFPNRFFSNWYCRSKYDVYCCWHDYWR
jgi:transketolase C-terminal domain/subunit